jgi:hypothetical protein
MNSKRNTTHRRRRPHQDMTAYMTHYANLFLHARMASASLAFTVEPITEFPHCSLFHLIPQPAFNYFQRSHNQTIRRIQFVIDQTKYEVVIIWPNRDAIPEQHISRICEWFLFCHFAFPSTKTLKTVNLYWFATPWPKKLPKKLRGTLTQDEINTGMTSKYGSIEIVLYRQEEWYKVLMHETFHAFGFDFSAHDELANISREIIQSTFRVNSEIALYETYTEIWAEFLFLISEVERSGWTIPKMKRVWKQQCQFALQQCVKIWRHQSTGYYRYLSDPPLYEETHVFAYHVLKTMALVYFDEYLRRGFMDSVGMWNRDRVQDYAHFFVEKSRDRKWLRAVSGAENDWRGDDGDDNLRMVLPTSH